jgi:hypothetical protein
VLDRQRLALRHPPPTSLRRGSVWSLALEGVTVVRDVLSQVLDRVVVYRREQRGREFEAARAKLEWK